MRLSVIVITKNEAEHIAACLQSVAFADEIVVLDGGSTDETVALAKACGKNVQVHVNTAWSGFGLQKNRALDLAFGEWVLALDADERLTPKLARDIQAIVANDAPSQQSPQVYAMPRLSSFCGAYMHHSGWRPDYVYRLFRRGVARFSHDRVHEHLHFEPNTPSGKLQADLLHLSFNNVAQVIDKMQRYSSERAIDLSARGKSGGLARALGHGLWAFIRTYWVRLGFLDGRRGLILAIANAEGTYYRYLKMSPDLNRTKGFAP